MLKLKNSKKTKPDHTRHCVEVRITDEDGNFEVLPSVKAAAERLGVTYVAFCKALKHGYKCRGCKVQYERDMTGEVK